MELERLRKFFHFLASGTGKLFPRAGSFKKASFN